MTAPSKPETKKPDAPKAATPAAQSHLPRQMPPKAKRVAVAPENESREDRFKRIAGMRLPRALYAIQRLEALGGPAYSSSPEQNHKLIAMLQEAIGYVEDALTRKSASRVDPKKPITL